MEQTSLAAGDFAKTSDSWANQTRILSEQFKELLSVIGTGLIPVFTPIVKSLNTILTQLIAIASQAGAVMSKLFGVSIPVADTKKFSQDMSAAAGGAGELADGVEEAGKEAKKALAPFDDLMVLADKAGGKGKGTGAGAAGGGFEVPKLDMKDVEATPVEEKFIQMAETIRNVMADLFAPLKTAWENQGQFVMDSWRYALEQIGLLAVSVGSDFMEVWKQPETTAILENILIIIGDIGLIVGNLAERFRTAWEENDVGLRILENIRDIFADIIERVRNIADATVEWTKTLDFSPLLESVNTLLEAIEPLADNIGAGLEWFWKNVLLPLAGWTIEDVIPAFLDGMSGAISALDGIIVAFTPTGKWLWNDFLKPMGEFAGDVFVASMEAIGEALKAFGDWIADNQDAVSTFVAVLVAFFDIALITKITDMGLALAAYIINAGGLAAVLHTLTASLAANTTAWWANISAKLADKLETIEIIALYAKDFAVKLAQGTAELAKQAAQFAINTAAKIADTAAQWAMTAATVAWNAICAVATAATTALGAAIAFLTSPIGIAIIAIGAIIAAGVLLYENWDLIKQKAGELKDWIVEKFNELLTWFSRLPAKFSEFGANIINGLKNGILGAWESLTSTIGSVASSIVDKFKDILGIHSPSTVMEENGAYMVKGLENGIASSIDNVYALFSPDTWTELGQNMFNALMATVEEFKALWLESFTLWQEENLELFFGYDLWYEQWYQFMQAYLDVNELFMSEWYTNIEKWWKTMVTPYFEIAKWKTFGDNMKNGIITGFKVIVNEIAGVLNRVITLFNSAYSQLSGAMNALIDDYNSKAAIMGTAMLGHVSYNPMAMLKVPELATGAVIRGGNSFMAILGDQPAGRVNVEAPADLIRDMARQGIREELSGLSFGGGSTRIISLNVDGQEFARLTLGGFLEEMNRQGYNVEVLGVT